MFKGRRYARFGLLLSLGVFRLGCAYSQTAAAPNGGPAAAESEQIGEIVVTAQRREERLQDVPISVAVISADDAQRQGIFDITSLPQAVVGLDFSKQVNAATPFIRGIGTPNGAVGNEPEVATYVDDVYIANGQSDLFSFNNIDNVQVLRGPQGTLFGRNATGGVVQIVTQNPSEATVVRANVGYGNYQTAYGQFYASTGIAPGLAVDIAAFGNNQNQGWGRNLTTGQEVYDGYDFGVRSKLKWDIDADTSAILAVDFSTTRSETGINLILEPGTIGPDGVTTYKGPYSPQGGDVDYAILRNYGASLHVVRDFSWASIKNITAYRGYRVNAFDLDEDGTPAPLLYLAPIDQRSDTWTEELQVLSAKSSAVTWIAGAYYLHDNSAYDPLGIHVGPGLPLALTESGQQITDSFSGYGQASYEILPRTTVTLGGRYTTDHRVVQGYDDLGGVEQVGQATQGATFKAPSWRFAVDYKFTPDLSTFASYDRGFKSGVFSLLEPSEAPVKPERLDSFEVGMKSEWAEHRLRVNGTLFHYDYKDIQVTQITPTGNINVNAAKAELYGGELEAIGKVSSALQLTAGVAGLHGKYLSFPGGPTAYFEPATCAAGELPGARTGGEVECAADLSGKTTIHSPKWTTTLAADWLVPSTVGAFDANVSIYDNSGFYWEADNVIRQGGYALLNASLRWTTLDERYYVTAWGRNLTDRVYQVFAGTTAFGESGSPGAPRTWGVTFGLKF